MIQGMLLLQFCINVWHQRSFISDTNPLVLEMIYCTFTALHIVINFLFQKDYIVTYTPIAMQ
jgi:hypothetical protein